MATRTKVEKQNNVVPFRGRQSDAPFTLNELTTLGVLVTCIDWAVENEGMRDLLVASGVNPYNAGSLVDGVFQIARREPALMRQMCVNIPGWFNEDGVELFKTLPPGRGELSEPERERIHGAVRARGYDPNNMQSRCKGLVEICLSNPDVLKWATDPDQSKPIPNWI